MSVTEWMLAADHRPINRICGCENQWVVRTLGWTYPFMPLPWPDIRTQFRETATRHPDFEHMAAIADSVIFANATEALAGSTSMFDLLVVRTPIAEPPYDLIWVSSPASIRPVSTGHVVIEHITVTGNNDRISRPSDDAVRLFWRFTIEKFGIEPRQDPN